MKVKFLILSLALVTASCASAPPLEVASTSIDAARASLAVACPYSSPACDKAVLALNDVIAGYNLALAAKEKGLPGADQQVADAAVAVMKTIEGLLPAKVASDIDGGS